MRSCALLFSWKKIIFFWKYFFPYYRCWAFLKRVEKSCDARFFGAKTVLRFFLGFQKKVEKITFFAIFSEKSLWSRGHFRPKSYYRVSCKNAKKMSQKKRKKKGFSFFETFFLKWKLDIYFCPFLKLKKKFWKLKNFPFSPSRWIIRWDGE